MVHPRYIRNAKRALLFGLIWLLFGLVYSILEQGILGRLEYYPATKNKYDFKSSLIYVSTGSFLVGLLHGWLEVSWLSKKFNRNALWVKIIFKALFYLVFLILFLVTLFLFVNSYRFGVSFWDPEVVDNLKFFMTTFAFWSVLVYVAFALVIAMLFSELASYLGSSVFLNFLFGKYHTPKKETRIFMFLDMKSSTTIAEQIGHAKYFELLKDCYADMANPILETSGEIYQYVGDEVVVTWTEKVGLYKNNCVECFFKIARTFEKRKSYYERKYGSTPIFKAGFHLGLVTTGEIGTFKKEIIYTGDVLNTTARIQAECNTYAKKILVSKALVQLLKHTKSIQFNKVAQLQLRGKTKSVGLFTIEKDKG